MNTNIGGVNIDNIPVPDVPVPDQYRPWLKYIYPIVALLIAAGAFALLILPTLNDALALKTEGDQNSATATILDAKLSTLKSADKTKLNDDLDKLEGALPTDKDAAGFLANINLNANTAGVSIQSVQLVPAAAAAASATPGAGASTSANVLEFQVAVNGDFPKVRDFLTRIETTRRVMAVKSIALTFDKDLTASLSIDTYFQPAPTVVPGNVDLLPARTGAQDKIFTDIDSRTVIVPPIITPNASGRTDPFSGF